MAKVRTKADVNKLICFESVVLPGELRAQTTFVLFHASRQVFCEGDTRILPLNKTKTMDLILIVLGAVAMFVLIIMLLAKRPRPSLKQSALTVGQKALLEEHVRFYQRLDANDKQLFSHRVAGFLSQVKINGVNTGVDDLDRVLIGASAIIPIFGFPEWEYINLREVLLYPETFNEAFEQEGGDRPVMGMVGTGPMQQVMIVSRHALREGFFNKSDKQNTAIHEFVHLIDKTDGDTDGVPEALLHHYSLPWVKMMHRYITEIARGKTDINRYAGVNEAEFFAVVSEYFFERPDLLREKHPELYEMLKTMFNR